MEPNRQSSSSDVIVKMTLCAQNSSQITLIVHMSVFLDLDFFSAHVIYQINEAERSHHCRD